MCLRPQFISKGRIGIDPLILRNSVRYPNPDWTGFRTRNIYTRIDAHTNARSYDSQVENSIRPTHFYGYTVPCGKCAECLKAKQNDLAVRCYLEAKKKGSMHFMTLTYDNANLPLSRRIVLVDKSTGEVYSDYKSSNLYEYEYQVLGVPLWHFVSKFENLPASRSPRYVYFGADKGEEDKVKKLIDFPFYDDNYQYGLMITPSLQRRDVQLWLKRCRIQYERHFHKPCPKFSYVVCGEYGPRTCRPHYHIGLFGLDTFAVQYFSSLWEYGFTKYEKVRLKNNDKRGSNGWLAASKYIAKYITKGVFECPSVKDGYAMKGRVQTSIEFGIDLKQKEIDFFRCYDLVGRFDINRIGYTLVPCSTEISSLEDLPYTIDDFRKLHEEVKRRQKIELNGFEYNLPKNVVKRIWYNKDSEGVWHPSTVQRIFTSFIQSDFLDDFIREFRESCPNASDEDISKAIPNFQSLQIVLNEKKEDALQKAQLNFYNKSLF